MLYIPGVLADADDAYRRLDYDLAAELLVDLLTIDPDDERARRRLHGVAAEKWTRAPADRFTRWASRIRIRLLLRLQEKPKERIHPLMCHLCDDPLDHRMRLELAAALSSRAHWRASAMEAGLLLEIDPRNLRAGEFLVRGLMNSGRREEAREVLERIERIHGETRETLRMARDIAAGYTMGTSCFTYLGAVSRG